MCGFLIEFGERSLVKQSVKHMTLVTVVSIDSRPSGYILRCFLKHFTYSFFACLLGGLVGEWLACWTQAQKGPG